MKEAIIKAVRLGYEPVFERARMVLVSANVHNPYVGEWFKEYAERVYADVARRIEEDEKKYGQISISPDETC